MAKLELNSALKNVRGAIDNWVYKRTASGPTLSRVPVHLAPPTAAQLVQRDEFREAARYAKVALQNPAAREVYERVAKERGNGVRGFSVALADWFRPPEVAAVDVVGYNGQVGGTLRVLAIDDVEVVSVHVTIRGADNTMVEEGTATHTADVWVYTATAIAPVGEPLTITAVAMDRAENASTKTVGITVPAP